MRRRGKGEGSITQRADGRWQASYVGNDGKRHYLYADKRPGVTTKLASAINAKEFGVFAGPTPDLTDFLNDWLKAAERRLKPGTIQRYAGIVRHHISPAIGSVPVGKVTPQQLSDLLDDLSAGDRPQSPASVAQVRTVLHSALDRALRLGLIGRNPADLTDRPRLVKRAMVVLDPSQVRALIEDTAGTEMGTLYALAAHTGMRQGELLALRWRDVNLDAGRIEVNATLTRLNRSWVRTSPKSEASVRTVGMTGTVRAVLRRHKVLQAERHLAQLGHRPAADTLIFTDRWGEGLNGFHITERHLKPLLRRLSLPSVRFHDLRHAAASIMLSKRVPILGVSQMLGHSKPSMTLNVYAHLMPGDDQAALDALEQELSAG